MGRPKQVQAARPGSSRREFFKRSGAGTMAALAAAPGLLPGSAAAERERESESGPFAFLHGVASGDPLPDRVILWTRVTPLLPTRRIEVSYAVATDPSMKRVVLRGENRTDASRDYTVKVDAIGLKPGQTYYYQFKIDGDNDKNDGQDESKRQGKRDRKSPVGRTRTLPVGRAQSLRMAVVSCSNHAYGYFNAYARIAARADLDLVMHLGDYLYEYGANQYGSARTPEPATEILSLADYRARHAQYKRDADSQAMHRQHAFIAIWDDHETANNSWKNGAENHDAATEGDWNARVAAALQAYYEWMPVRVIDPANLRRDDRTFAFGDLADLIMLEERLGARSEQLPAPIPLGNGLTGFTLAIPGYTDPTRQMLGAEEEGRLFNQLRSTSARWKLLGQGVMFSQLKAVGAPNAAGGGVFFNSDQWDGYPPARQRIFDVLQGAGGQPKVNNVVVLTGDIHSSFAADVTPDPNNPTVALGGYDKATGEGAIAVEFVGTSVTSPGAVPADPGGAVANSLKPANPHLKYINLDKRGYMLIDVNRDRVVSEWWYVDTVASPSNIETFATAWEVRTDTQRLQPSSQTPNRPNPPALAP